jgi:hypothetical protein
MTLKEVEGLEEEIKQDVHFLLGDESFSVEDEEMVCKCVRDRNKVIEAFFAPWGVD